SAGFYLGRRHAAGQVRGYLALSEEEQRRHRLLNCRVEPRRTVAANAAADALDRDVRAVAADVDAAVGDPLVAPGRFHSLSVIAEQAPNPESRVRLGDPVDAFGQRRVVLDWRLGSFDSASVRRTLDVLARQVAVSGLGRLRVAFPEEGFAGLDPRGSYHHMGTTRMHPDPKQGVVDSRCRVHGLANLFVAGSSVFPTYGTNNPTLTILALAFRLSDHLKELLV
ncbi:MAG: GMC family oxidoreductase, partial [Proteobacteria bacterium]|nr:GMC family oxidoreductase [Pseudomonadota bacterium]